MTEKAYVGWIKRFVFFHNKRHPAEMAEAEIAQFLSSLANDSHVGAATQNQALNALLFLYHEVLGKKIGYVAGVVRAKTKQVTRRVDPAGGENGVVIPLRDGLDHGYPPLRSRSTLDGVHAA